MTSPKYVQTPRKAVLRFMASRKRKKMDDFPEKVKELAENGHTYRSAVIALSISPNRFVKLLHEHNLNWKQLRQDAGFAINSGSYHGGGRRAGSIGDDLPFNKLPPGELERLAKEDEKPNLPIRVATEEEMERWGFK